MHTYSTTPLSDDLSVDALPWWQVAHLLSLFYESFSEEVPGDVLHDAAGLLEALVNGHSPKRHVAVAQNPLPRLVDILACGQVHHGVGAPDGGPLELAHFLQA